MKPAADQARAMGDYIREHGFSPFYHAGTPEQPRCGCFYHAIYSTVDDRCERDLLMGAIEEVIGLDYLGDGELMAAGYASDADRSKAVEACYAAARMLEES